jgi:regulator of nucleoside diphosphate kinase
MREAPSVLTQPRRRNSLVVTAVDARRLRALIRRQRFHVVDAPEALGVGALDAELRHATIVHARAMPGDVVTMNSRLVCEDERTGLWSRLNLVYPTKALREDDVSVLAPLGTALLGMSVGQVVEARARHPAATRLRITALPYQPERAGDYHV